MITNAFCSSYSLPLTVSLCKYSCFTENVFYWKICQWSSRSLLCLQGGNPYNCEEFKFS